jgi:hypothetical protein
VGSGSTVHEWGHECTNGVGGEWEDRPQMGPRIHEWGGWRVAIGKWKPLRLCTSAPLRYVKLWEWRVVTVATVHEWGHECTNGVGGE